MHREYRKNAPKSSIQILRYSYSHLWLYRLQLGYWLGGSYQLEWEYRHRSASESSENPSYKSWIPAKKCVATALCLKHHAPIKPLRFLGPQICRRINRQLGYPLAWDHLPPYQLRTLSHSYLERFDRSQDVEIRDRFAQTQKYWHTPNQDDLYSKFRNQSLGETSHQDESFPLQHQRWQSDALGSQFPLAP